MKMACFLLLMTISATSFAQSNYAALVGTVSDPQSRAIPGAAIQITSPGAKATRKVTRNELGTYRITGLLPGEYEIEATASGFASVKKTLRLEVGQQLTLDLSLKLASVATTIEVGAVDVPRRFSKGMSILANYTWSKSLTDAPDFRSPMFEAAIPQDNNNLRLEKGLGCDIRHRFALSAVFDLPGVGKSGLLPAITKG